MNIIRRIQSAALYPLARAIIEFQSRSQRLKTLGKPEKILISKPYNGQAILLLALYEKGYLRKDVVRLLKEAKQQGLYVLAVNTLKLKSPESFDDILDCYIERPNFGRDFGSYKTGFLHLYRMDWHRTCPRLLMMNDSVYYSSRGLAKFIKDLTEGDSEVLGATENYEIEYHLGSFCIAMSGSVLASAQLQKYWRGYRLTDVRPLVIKRGEQELTKVLKRCVTAPDQFRALYNSERFLHEVKASPKLQELVIKDSRSGENSPSPRFGVDQVLKVLSGRYLARRHIPEEGQEIKIDSSLSDINEEVLILGLDDLKRYVSRNVRIIDKDFDELIGDSISTVASEVFMFGSQIHQNAIILLNLGLPIVKIDGLYRGMFNNHDVIRIQKKLPDNEARELGAILMERPFGGDMLDGWKRTAFMRGLI